jgi:hypothetical protein
MAVMQALALLCEAAQGSFSFAGFNQVKIKQLPSCGSFFDR